MGDALKPGVDCMKDELTKLCLILRRHKDKLSSNSAEKKKANFFGANTSDSNKRSVVKLFDKSLKAVKVSDDEYLMPVDSAFNNKTKKNPGRRSAFSACVNVAVQSAVTKLRGMPDYKPLFLTDEEMGIDKYAEAIGDPFLNSTARAAYRQKFRSELKGGVSKMCIHIFGKTYSGQNPDCIFVWKVPAIHPPQHVGNVAKAVKECQQTAPQYMTAEAVRHFNAIFDHVANVSAPLRDAMRNYLLGGDANPDGTIADEYVDFVMNLAAGQPIDEAVLLSGRTTNSRGGKGIGATKFEAFWKACQEILLPDSATDERRHGDNVYASAANSIPNLIQQATDNLQRKVDANEIDTLPAIPSVEWVRLQFVPNVLNSALAAKFTGRLEAKRAVQTRTLRKEHQDQHWVNASTRYYLEWIVELRKIHDGVEFFGQDDKAKIPCGDAVPVSTGVRANNKGIVANKDEKGLKAMDHDFHYANIVPSVTLRCNIPSEISGSFFAGDEDGIGQIFVTLKDATFDPSNVFDHCAQLIDTVKKKGLTPTVLVLQTDGGSDHSLKRVATQLAMIAVFKELNLDHLVILRGAPNGSARNKVERSMSVLNLALAHMSLKREKLPEWAELKLKSCSTMKAVREVGDAIEEKRSKALSAVVKLEKSYVALSTKDSGEKSFVSLCCLLYAFLNLILSSKPYILYLD